MPMLVGREAMTAGGLRASEGVVESAARVEREGSGEQARWWRGTPLVKYEYKLRSGSGDLAGAQSGNSRV